jgi:hypothetical protein
MKTIAFAAATAATISITLITAPAFAHHPFAPEFDWKKPVTLTGAVTKVEWTNPHAFATIDVKDAGGKITSWTVELGSPRVLEKNYRWKANTLAPGGNVSVDGWLAKDGHNSMSAKSFTLSDGRELFAASSFFDLPGKCVSDDVCVDDKTTGNAVGR